MRVEDVLDIYHLLVSHDIDVWLDGGWAVDAHLGKQTRDHADIDVIIQVRDIGKLRSLLEACGYVEIKL